MGKLLELQVGTVDGINDMTLFNGTEGEFEGLNENVGSPKGFLIGSPVGVPVGMPVGSTVGWPVGGDVGAAEGFRDG